MARGEMTVNLVEKRYLRGKGAKRTRVIFDIVLQNGDQYDGGFKGPTGNWPSLQGIIPEGILDDALIQVLGVMAPANGLSFSRGAVQDQSLVGLVPGAGPGGHGLQAQLCVLEAKLLAVTNYVTPNKRIGVIAFGIGVLQPPAALVGANANLLNIAGQTTRTIRCSIEYTSVSGAEA